MSREASTVIVIACDDSNGWYDHVPPPIVNGSNDAKLDDPALCGPAPATGSYADRRGYGPRLPLLVVSPYSRTNFVDHTRTDQTSILKFVEDDRQTDRIGDSSFDELAGDRNGMFDFGKATPAPVLLDPNTGAVDEG